MKAPKEIYLFQSKNDGSVGVAHHKHLVETEKVTSIKYIRADLAELTWGDMKRIDLCFHEVATKHTIGKLKLYSFQEMYEEVLRRFLERKKEKYD